MIALNLSYMLFIFCAAYFEFDCFCIVYFNVLCVLFFNLFMCAVLFVLLPLISNSLFDNKKPTPIDVIIALSF